MSLEEISPIRFSRDTKEITREVRMENMSGMLFFKAKKNRHQWASTTLYFFFFLQTKESTPKKFSASFDNSDAHTAHEGYKLACCVCLKT